jgi:glutathione S-transferase
MSRELVLHDAAISGNAYKVRLLLSQLGLRYRRIAVDLLAGEARTAAFRALNPFGRVPFLLDGDFALAESNAILFHLAQGSRLWPAEARDQALALQWMFFEQNQVEASIAVVRYFVRFAPGHPHRSAAEALLVAKGEASLAVLERHLAAHDFLVGGYGVADIALFGYVHVAPEGGFDLGPFPAVRAWIERVRAQPGFVPMEG